MVAIVSWVFAILLFVFLVAASSDADSKKKLLKQANNRIAELEKTELELRNEVVSQGILIGDYKSWHAQLTFRNGSLAATLEAIADLVKKSQGES